jgi:hypothetical protein
VRVHSPLGRTNPRLATAVRRMPRIRRSTPASRAPGVPRVVSLSLSLSLRRLGGLQPPPPPPPLTPLPPRPYARCRGLRRSLRRRRAQPGILIPSLLFLLCKTEHPNPNLNLFGYLIPTDFKLFFCKTYRV